MTAKEPFLTWISVGLPILGAVAGMVVAASRRHGGDYGTALASGIFGFLVMAGACGLGVIAAAAALARGERTAWIAGVSLAVNMLVFLPGAFLAARIDP